MSNIRNVIKRTLLLTTTAVAVGITPLTAFAQSQETQVVQESDQNGKPFSIKGNGEVVDDLSNDSSKQFITVKTKDNQTYFMVIDRAQSTENVYMLSMVDADDLKEFSSGGGSSAEQVVSEANKSSNSTSTTTEETKDTDKGSSSNLILFGVIAVVGAIGAGVYFKVIKPKKQRKNEKDEGIENDGEIFDDDEEINEDDKIDEEEEEYEDFTEDEYEDESFDYRADDFDEEEEDAEAPEEDVDEIYEEDDEAEEYEYEEPDYDDDYYEPVEEEPSYQKYPAKKKKNKKNRR